MEKVQNKLTGWKAKTLSLAGRCTLIQSVLAGIPSYAMQSAWLPNTTCDALNKLNRNFLWGSTEEKRRIHMVKWAKVTKPKCRGGLGIRDARQANIAQLAKIGSRMVCGIETMWAQILRGKYTKGKSFMDCDIRTGNSSTWRGVVRSFYMVKGGFGWIIGKGKDISIWFDIWVGNGPLCMVIDDIDPIESMLNVEYILNEEGRWVLDRLKTNIPEAVRKKFLAIKPLSTNDGADRVVWKGSSNGVPTAKSFFNFITYREEEATCNSWSWVWKMDVPQKMRFFMWLMIQEKLATNLYRSKIGIAESDVCSKCNQQSESVIHMIRDCNKSQEVWKSFIPISKWQRFFSSNLNEWVNNNVDDTTRIGTCTGTDWKIMFASIGWHIWKARNEEVFEKKYFSPFEVAKLSSLYVSDLKISLDQLNTFNLDPVNGKWFKPLPGYTKLNVNGGFCDGKGTFGGVLRDGEGKWIWGFKGSSNAGDSLHAEILALKVGINALVEKDCSRTIIEMDSSQVVNLMHGYVEEEHPRRELIMECKKIKWKVWNCTVNFVPRSYNGCADKLSKSISNANMDWRCQKYGHVSISKDMDPM